MENASPMEDSHMESLNEDKILPPLPEISNDNDLELNNEVYMSDEESNEEIPIVNEPETTRNQQLLQQNHIELRPEPEGDEEIALDPNHPLLARIQAAIHQQLSKYELNLSQQLLEKVIEINENTELKKEQTRREDAGVELYTLQQNLARLQALLESAEENFGVISGLREEAERELKLKKTVYDKEAAKRMEQEKNFERRQIELEKISRTLKEVDLYNEELRSKILVAKRTTLKAEKDILKQEIQKKRQDFYIDMLTENLRKLQEKKASYDSQIYLQQKETQAATATLHDAEIEMEAIRYEKRQLLNQWNSSLIGLKKRNEMENEVENAIKENAEKIALMEREIQGFKKNLRKVQEEGESLTGILSRIDSEREYTKREIGTIAEQREKMAESYNIYMKSLSQTEKELNAAQQERNSIQQSLNLTQKAIVNNSQTIQSLEEEIAEQLETNSGISKDAQNAIKQGKLVRNRIHEKEIAIANLANELTLIDFEIFKCEMRIKTLKEEAQTLTKDIDEKSGIISKYEVEMRQNNDQLSKKAGEMDLLNKKLDQLTDGDEDSHMGPLEATIYNLNRAVIAKDQECLQLQQLWLKVQNELVQSSKYSSTLSDDIQTLKMRLTVLNRKKMVMNNAFETEEKAIKEHNSNIRKLRNDMVKINTIISSQSKKYDELEDSNLDIELKFRNALKVAELESLRMEEALDKLKDEKERALVGLIEAERQIMLWEKKIQLARETQAALDPNVGATEIREMGLEIHRMELRYASMLKLQEKMIAEMEKSVYRRESISSKDKAKNKNNSQISLNKAIADLSKKIEHAVRDIKECEQDISDLDQAKDNLQDQIEDASQSIEVLNNKIKSLEVSVEGAIVKKQQAMSSVVIFQKLHRRYQDLNDGKYKEIQINAEQRATDIYLQKGRIEKIMEIQESMTKDVDAVKAEILKELRWFAANTVADVDKIYNNILG